MGTSETPPTQLFSPRVDHMEVVLVRGAFKGEFFRRSAQTQYVHVHSSCRLSMSSATPVSSKEMSKEMINEARESLFFCFLFLSGAAIQFQRSFRSTVPHALQEPDQVCPSRPAQQDRGGARPVREADLYRPVGPLRLHGEGRRMRSRRRAVRRADNVKRDDT